MKFTYNYGPEHPRIEISLHKDSTLDSVLEAFEGFLKAAGYSFDGHLEFVNEDLMVGQKSFNQDKLAEAYEKETKEESV